MKTVKAVLVLIRPEEEGGNFRRNIGNFSPPYKQRNIPGQWNRQLQNIWMLVFEGGGYCEDNV